MTWRGTIGLVVVLGALVAALRWDSAPAPDGPAIAGAALLAGAPPLTALDIHVAAATHRFEHTDGRWRAANADVAPDAVPGLLEALRTLSPLMVVDDAPSDPSDFGLGPDAVRLVVWAGSTAVLDLDVGARNPAWTAVYVRRHGAQAIEMIGALLTWELAKVLAPHRPGNALTRPHETREPS